MAVHLPKVHILAIEKALRDEVNDLVTCPSTVGIAVFGSVASGDCQEGSDIEIQVTDSSTPERKTTLTTRHGVLIHKHTQAAIDFTERAEVVWRIRPPFADSWIVVDCDGQLKRLKSDQRVASAGRRKLTSQCAERYQLELTAKRQELTRFIDASENLALFCYEAVSRAADIFYAERPAWYPGSKRVMKDLAASHPHLHGLVCSALRTDREQVRSTIALLDFVLEILGGPRISPVEIERLPSAPGEVTNASVACLDGCRVLLVQRSPGESSFPSNWEFPGGRIESGETPAEAATREFREECGCEVNVREEVARFSWDADGRRSTEVVFAGTTSGPIRLSGDHCDYAWVRHEDLAGGRFPCSPELLSIGIRLCRGKSG